MRPLAFGGLHSARVPAGNSLWNVSYFSHLLILCTVLLELDYYINGREVMEQCGDIARSWASIWALVLIKDAVKIL